MNERDIFLAALEIADPAARRNYLDKVCSDNDALRASVESLFASHEGAGDFLKNPIVQSSAVEPTVHSSLKQQALNSESDESDEDDEVALGFLTPSTKPGSLGRLGHYEVLEVLGRGAFGTVLKAFDEKLHRMVAIKVMSVELASTSPARKRFLREARSAAAIRHDNVVAIHAVEEQPIPYLVMEYIPGRTLQQVLEAHGPLDIADTLRLSQQMASGLAAAHSQGLIHRDIKPANILLEEGIQWKVKITDFGLARAADDASMTQSGTIAGTPMYMSPEQAHSNHIDQRSDLFSFGSVLYQMVSGRAPFRASSALGVLKRVTEDTPRPIPEIIPEVPDWLCTIISKLHSKRPDDRYQTAAEVTELLVRCQSELQLAGSVTCVQSSHHALRDDCPAPAQPSTIRPQPSQTTSPGAVAQSSSVPQGSTRRSETTTLNRSRLITASIIAAAAIIVIVILNRNNNRSDTASGGRQLSEPTPEISNAKSRISNNASEIANGTSIDPDRRAARWVVSIGGLPRITEGDKDWEVGRLPDAPFELRGVNFYDNLKVTDTGLANFRGCQNLRSLRFHLTPVTDAGMVYFRDCKRLNSLDLGLIPVSDAGLANFQGCNDLTYLSLDRIPFTEAGLSHFKDCTEITELVLNGAGLTDAGLAHFQNCRNLTKLNLTGREVTDAGMAHFKDLKSLTNLSLSCQNVTEAGLASFNDCQKLTDLVLSGPTASDESLAQFENCRNLTYLTLMRTKVSDAGLELLATWPQLRSVTVLDSGISNAAAQKFAAALPSCSIKWNGGVIEPTATTDPDRRAAEWALSIGGTINIKEKGQERPIGSVGDLPQEAFELTAVNFNSNKKVSDAGLALFNDCKNLTHLQLYDAIQITDAGMAHFKDCKNLTYLSLYGTQVGDVGLTHFKDCKNLTSLHLRSTQVSDAGLAHFQDCKKLTSLDLLGTQVSDAGLAHFKECKNLNFLSLGGTQASNAGLAHFKDCKNLTGVDLTNTKVSDAGLAQLKDCKNLTALWLSTTQVSDVGLEQLVGNPNLGSLIVKNTKVTEAGVKKLSAALPGCKIEWDGGVIESQEL